MRLEGVSPEVLNPPAIVQAAFDEERAIADIKAAVERRNEAKGEFQDAILFIGQKLVEARRAMPGAPLSGGRETYSAQFLTFVEKCGVGRETANKYMQFARNPDRLAAMRKYRSWGDRRRRFLEEVLDLLVQAPDKDSAVQVIREELSEIK